MMYSASLDPQSPQKHITQEALKLFREEFRVSEIKTRKPPFKLILGISAIFNKIGNTFAKH